MPTNRSYSGHTKGNIMAADLRQLLLKLYLINNFKLEHKVYIYTYRGVTDLATNPFQYVSGDVAENVKKSLILQNLASGEMLQAFIVPTPDSKGKTHSAYEIENTVLYGNKAGVIIEIGLDKDKIEKTDKYRQFSHLAVSMLRQFVD